MQDTGLGTGESTSINRHVSTLFKGLTIWKNRQEKPSIQHGMW